MTVQSVDPFEADIRREPCPECGARADRACTMPDGREQSESHRGRERQRLVRRSRELVSRARDEFSYVDWTSPTWGRNPIHVSRNGDLAGEEPVDG